MIWMLELIYTVLRLHEQLSVEQWIRPNLSGKISKDTSSQLEKILEEQFREGRYGEVGGCIVPVGKRLEFEMVESREKQEIERALSDYEAGTITQESHQLLLKYAFYVKEHHEKHLGDKNPYVGVLSGIHEIFSVSPATGNFKRWNEQIRKKICLLYKEHILDMVYPISFSEMNPDYIGLFHVHQNGTEPSPHDIEKNMIMPILDVVVSATREYRNEGITLYLVHNGAFETLYQGLLRPARKK